MSLSDEQRNIIHDAIAPHLDAIKKEFKGQPKVTVLVRFTDDPNGLKDFMIGDDEPQEAMNLIARRMYDAL
jgi:hypothetical protein